MEKLEEGVVYTLNREIALAIDANTKAYDFVAELNSFEFDGRTNHIFYYAEKIKLIHIGDRHAYFEVGGLPNGYEIPLRLIYSIGFTRL